MGRVTENKMSSQKAIQEIFKSKPYDLDAGVLNFDIECTPTKGWAYTSFKARVFDPDEYYHIQSIACGWANKKTIECKALPDFPLYKTEPHNDYELVKWAHGLLSRATLLVGHNIDRFDIPKLRHRFLMHGLPPLPKKDTRDTYKMGKRFGFFSRSLDGMAREAGLTPKEKIGAKDLWKPCYDGIDDDHYWPLYKKYNKQDVDTDKQLYRLLVSWEDRMPKLNVTNDCPVCHSTMRDWKRNGLKYYQNYQRQRYACLRCGFANIYSEPIQIEWNIRQ